MCRFVMLFICLTFVASVGRSMPQQSLVHSYEYTVIVVDSLLEKQAKEIAKIQHVLDTDFGEYKNKPSDLATYIYHASERVKIKPRILMNLMAQESGFRTGVVSKAGAVGIMQVMPRHWNVTADEMRDYRQATHQGAEILAQYRDSCNGDMVCALHKYNVGPELYAKGMRNHKFVARGLRGIHV